MNEPGVTCGGPGAGRRLDAVGLQAAVSCAWAVVRLAALSVVDVAVSRLPSLRACAAVARGGLAAAQPAAPASRTVPVSIAAVRTTADHLPLPLTRRAPVVIGIPRACGSVPRRSRPPL